MSEPKKHHFLPQFYLDGFEFKTEGKKIKTVVYPKHKEPCEPYIASVEDTGCKRDYHTLEIDEEKDRASVETMLSKIEGEHSIIVDNMIVNQDFSDNEKVELAFFLNLMRCRVPSVKKYLEEFHKNLVEISANILQRQGKFPDPPPIIKEMMDRNEQWFEVKISNWKLVQSMLDMASHKEIINLICQMNFSILKAPAGNFFITSDTPVSIYCPNHEGPYGVGVSHPLVELFLPLTKSYGLFCSWVSIPRFKEITLSELQEYNRRTIIMADEYIYSCSNNPQINKAIKKYRNIKAGIQVDKLEHGDGGLSLSRTIPVTN